MGHVLDKSTDGIDEDPFNTRTLSIVLLVFVALVLLRRSFLKTRNCQALERNRDGPKYIKIQAPQTAWTPTLRIKRVFYAFAPKMLSTFFRIIIIFLSISSFATTACSAETASTYFQLTRSCGLCHADHYRSDSRQNPMTCLHSTQYNTSQVAAFYDIAETSSQSIVLLTHMNQVFLTNSEITVDIFCLFATKISIVIFCVTLSYCALILCTRHLHVHLHIGTPSEATNERALANKTQMGCKISEAQSWPCEKPCNMSNVLVHFSGTLQFLLSALRFKLANSSPVQCMFFNVLHRFQSKYAFCSFFSVTTINCVSIAAAKSCTASCNTSWQLNPGSFFSMSLHAAVSLFSRYYASSWHAAKYFLHHICFSKATVTMLIVSQCALFCPRALAVASGKITLSQASLVAATQATISFMALESIPSNGRITLQFPFGGNGDGRMPLLGKMYGKFIRSNLEALDIQAVNLLADGVTIVYMIEHDGFTKQVTLNPFTNKYYTGSISQFNPNNWSSYIQFSQNPATAGYLIKDQPVPLADYLPFIGSTGKCDILHPASRSASTSFVRNGNIIISVSTSVPQGPVTVTCSGLTVFPMASSFGGLRISTSQEPIPAVANFDCPVNPETFVHCSGVFKLGESHIPMLYMTEGSFAWIAIKYTSSTADAIVENRWNQTYKNFHVSHSILRSSISVADDILMVESSSSVYANMSTAAAFSKVRDNILGGCYWFKDTHVANNLSGWMSPFTNGAHIPDAKLGSSELGFCDNYRCCEISFCSSFSFAPCKNYDCSYAVLNSCNNVYGSHLFLNKHWRLRSGYYWDFKTHSIWFRIPLSLLVSASLPPLSVPISLGLIAIYTADSWQTGQPLTSASWFDLSGSGNHVTDIGGTTNITVARPIGAPAYIHGASTAWMKFPAGILPSANYTLFYIARYNGPSRRRIFQGVDTNAIIGFHGGRAGISFHGYNSNCLAISDNYGYYGTDWFMGAERSNSLRSNGVDRTMDPRRTSTCVHFDRLAINTGNVAAETSDFAIQHVLVYNRRLTDSDIARVEAWLTSLQPDFTPANLQGVVGFYDAQDLVVCSGTCSWSPRAGFLGPLTGTASVSGDGWVMYPRMATTGKTGITESQPYTSIVGFKLSTGGDTATRTLVQIGGASQCRAQLLSASGLRLSGCVNYPTEISFSREQQTTSSHVWAAMHDGGTNARSYWNGAYFSHTTTSTWNTVDGPLYVGRSASGASSDVLPGGVRFVLLLNRALTQTEVAAVARWSWNTNRVGLDLMNFSPDAWTGVSAGQVFWTPPVHMQPLSSRTVRFLLNITKRGTPDTWRSIVRFGATGDRTGDDRMMSFWIGSLWVQVCTTMATITNADQICFNIDSGIVGPSLVTVAYSRTTLSTFVNSIKQSYTQVSPGVQLSSGIADTDNTRKARNGQTTDPPASPEGFLIRSLQLLDYTMSDLEAQAPVIISVTPQVLFSSSTGVTVIGSPFNPGAACSALFLDGSVTPCSAVSAVEIIVTISNMVPSIRPSMLSAVMHNGLTFRAPIACVAPYFVADSSGSCAALSLPGSIALTSNLAASTTDDAIMKLNWPDSSAWVNNGEMQPVYDAVDGSWVFNASKSQYFDAGPRTLRNPESGFTVTASVLIERCCGFFQRIIDFGSGISNSNIQFSFLGASSQLDFEINPNVDIASQGHLVITDFSLELKKRYSVTAVYYSESKTSKIYVDGIIRASHTFSSPIMTKIRSGNTFYIGKSRWAHDAYFDGRMKFLAVYDRALPEAEILNQHKMQMPSLVNSNITLTLSFTLPSGTSVKTVSVTGVRFSSYKGSPDTVASCSNLQASSVVVTPSYTPPVGPLVLRFSASTTSSNSSDAVVCRVSGFSNSLFSTPASYAQLSTHDANGIFQSRSSVLFPEILPRDISAIAPSSRPTTGLVHVSVFGAVSGLYDVSGRTRLGATACVSTQWQSETSTSCRAASGAGFGLSTATSVARQIKSKDDSFSYITPATSSATSHSISNINVTGSNFGTFLAILPLSASSSTSTTLTSNTIASVCTLMGSEQQSSGVAITEASASITFSSPTRLDDVVVSLRSPDGKEYTLMQKKCFGLFSCSDADSFTFKFQILPIAPLPSVPLVSCQVSGKYVPDDVIALRSALASSSAVGTWYLRVATGSEMQNISFASIDFKTTALDIRIGYSPSSSLFWYSDSSVSMKAPGYHSAQGFDSSSGWGHNRSVVGYSSGRSSPSSCVYSYPDPALTKAIVSAGYSSSGSTSVQLLGRYFSNANSYPRARMGLTTCTATRWLSDTALTCSQSPAIGSIQKLALTVEQSAVAIHSVLLSPESMRVNIHAFSAMTTGASVVTVDGTGFGAWDSSARVRVSNSFSAADSTVWLCDSRVETKFFPSIRNRPGLFISLVSILSNASTVKVPELQPSTVSVFNRTNAPSTGSVNILMAGSGFSVYDVSLRTAVGGSSCLESRWASSSSINCKVSTGLRQNSLSVIVSVLQLSGNGSQGLHLSFDRPAVNETSDIFSNNSISCFFNSSGCDAGHVIQLVQSSSGFGTSSFPQRELSVIQGSVTKPCKNSSWVSDSSVYCLFVASVSPEFRDIYVLMKPSSSLISIKNPFFIPAPPLLSNQTVKLRFYRNVMYPEGVDRQFLQFGTTSGFQWSNSSLTETVQYSQVLTFSFLIYIDASQFFMDSSFLPIETSISGEVAVINNDVNVTSMLLCDKVSSKQFTLLLAPRLFWAKLALSLPFCSPVMLHGTSLKLRANTLVRNVKGSISLIADSPSFYPNSSGASSITFIKSPAVEVSAATLYNELLAFRVIYGTGFDDECATVGSALLNYSILLVCSGKQSSFRSNLPEMGGFVEARTCLLNVPGVSFIRVASKCFFNVSVQTDRILSKVSQEFNIIPGLAKVAELVGNGPFCASASAIIWSVNSTSHGPCLVAQLQDTEGNNITSAIEAIVVARNANGPEFNYKIARSASNMSSTSGLIFWCDAYSSSTQTEGVYFGANVTGNITYWLSNIINVSRAGAPVNMLPNVTTAATVQTLQSGDRPKALEFVLRDAYGNDFSGGVALTIRVRVVPRINSSLGRSAVSASSGSTRRLLQLSTASASSCDVAETDQQLNFFFTMTPDSNRISVGPEFLCRAGSNDVFFDIGTLAGGYFQETSPSVFRINVTVIPGDFKSLMLVPFPTTFVAQSYSLISSLEIMFLDSGLNEVVGNASMSLAATNASAAIYPSAPFSVKSTANEKAIVPPFFIHISEWMASESPFLLRITIVQGSSSVPHHGSASVPLKLRPTCNPGYRIQTLAFTDILNVSVASATCVPCQPPFSSWYNDATRCLTLRWPETPHLLQSGRDVVVAGVSLRDESAGVHPSSAIFIVTTLVRGNSRRSLTSCRSRVTNGFGQSCTLFRVVYQQSPGLDYKWMLELQAADSNASLFALMLPSDRNVALLDFAPTVVSVFPSSISFIGGHVITLVGLFPQDALPERYFVKNASLPALFSDRCVFVSRRDQGNVTLIMAATRTETNNSIIFECRPLASGDSGPPFTSWSPSMALADGRNSTMGGNTVPVYCPKGFYIDSSAAAGSINCRQCPADKSISVAENQMSLSSCVCNVGYYGTFGDGCVACPKVKPASDGFNCTLTNQSRPAILPGYYIDYSLLNKCSEYGSKCNAIISCPNPAACPGAKEKDCVQNSKECYDKESFGCASCCTFFYMENLKCMPCPASQLPLVLSLALLGLLLFAVFSSSFDFPPMISAAQSLKVFLSGMQAYVAIRLIDIPWPSIVQCMFNFTRFFTFSFDVIRPECTVDYSPLTKLIFVLIGPFTCSFLIITMICLYAIFKCIRITLQLQVESVQRLCHRSFFQTVSSVMRCLFISSLCMKFSNTRMMIDGALWNALNPALVQRVSTTVLIQRGRRAAVLGSDQSTLYKGAPFKTSAIPEDWVRMQVAVSELNVENEFGRSAKRFRLLLASSMSIFVFTFQGCIEAALSTFDCKNVKDVLFLRSNPRVRCSLEDGMYFRMIATTITGMVIYCVLMPVLTIVTLRSQWCQDAYLHNVMAYQQMFGFLTSLYSRRYTLWELVACARKVLLVVIPVVVSREPLVQSVSIFLWLILYTFTISRVQPMASSNLNQLEVLSCTSVIVGSFSSIFFVIEYQGALVLEGSAREMAGVFLVMICAICTLRSLYLIWKEVSRLMLMHKDQFVTKWIVGITAFLGDACEEGFALPVYLLFYSEVASSSILMCKRNLRVSLAAITKRSETLKRVPWYQFITRMTLLLSLLWDRFLLNLSTWRSSPQSEDVRRCAESPEFEFLQYLRKLTQRMSAWREFPNKHLPVHDLPAEFRDVKGLMDPPHAEYSRLVDLQEIVDAFVSKDMQRTLLVKLLADKMNLVREAEPSHRAYLERFEGLTQEFCARFSDVNAIYQQLREVDHERHLAPVGWMQRIRNNVRRWHNSGLNNVLKLLPTLGESEIIDVTAKALGAKLPWHIKFQKSEPTTYFSKYLLTGSKRRIPAVLNPVSSGFHSSYSLPNASRPRKTLAISHAAVSSSSSSAQMQRTAAMQPVSNLRQTRCGESRGESLQEVIVQYDPRDLKLPISSQRKIKMSPHEDSTGMAASSTAHDRRTAAEVSKVHLPSDVGVQTKPPLHAADARFTRIQEQQVTARASQQRSIRNAVGGMSNSEDVQAHHRKSHAEVDIHEADPPHPFDGDLRTAKQRRKRTTARDAQLNALTMQHPLTAASDQRSTYRQAFQGDAIDSVHGTEYVGEAVSRQYHPNALSNSTRWDSSRAGFADWNAVGGMSNSEDVQAHHRKSHAEVDIHDADPPPPFGDGDLRTAKQRGFRPK